MHLAACSLHVPPEGLDRQSCARRPQAADAVAAGRPEPPLRIYEIGGGTGTLALNILVRTREGGPGGRTGGAGPRTECDAHRTSALQALHLAVPPAPAPCPQDWLRAEHPMAYAQCQ